MAKKYAQKTGEYIDEHRDELKERLQQIHKYIEELLGKDGEDRTKDKPIVFMRDPLTSDKLLATFGRVLPLRDHLVGSYANYRGMSQMMEMPKSFDKWCVSFNSAAQDVMLISLCIK